VQSAAEPALCRLSGPGLARAVAGQFTTFKLQVRTAGRILSVSVVPWYVGNGMMPAEAFACM
jgi:hypothetical protein